MERKTGNLEVDIISASIIGEHEELQKAGLGGVSWQLLETVLDLVPPGLKRMEITSGPLTGEWIEYDPFDDEQIRALEAITEKSIAVIKEEQLQQEKDFSEISPEQEVIMSPELWGVFYDTVVKKPNRKHQTNVAFWNTVSKILTSDTVDPFPLPFAHLQQQEACKRKILLEINTEIVLRTLEKRNALEVSPLRGALTKYNIYPIPKIITTHELQKQQQLLSTKSHLLQFTITKKTPVLAGVR